ncbi:DUF4175 domain-containing protein [Aestuariivirga litoralis]|uniref:DUF4175 domain-containing protein n=1 Tax=Aestuariivirga litoralis TaxID=2650924 RepID=UPI0032B28D2A
MSEPLPKHLSRSLLLQRLSLRWEGLWVALQGPLVVMLATLALLWSGLLQYVGRPLPAIILAILGLAFLYTLRPLFRLRPLPDHLVLRKLDDVNALKNREASSLGDRLVPEEEGASEIWTEHLRRKLAALRQLRVQGPASTWRKFDPLALRLPVIMAVVAAFFLGTGDLWSNLTNAASLSAPVPPKPVLFDAWLKPPAYTGKPPLLLTSAAMMEKLKTQNELTVPEGSILNLRVTGSTKPGVDFFSPGSTDTEVKIDGAKIEKTPDALTGDIKLDRPVSVRVSNGDAELATYHFSLIADETPKIEIIGTPEAAERGKLSVKWHASDDYGLRAIKAEISLADEQENGITGFESNGVFLYDPPEFKMTLKKPGAKDDTETSTTDLTAHAWAGLYAEIILTATDAAGHKTSTAPTRFKLPDREFIKPLARALVEQRKHIILDPNAAPDASTLVGAMLLYPSDIASNSGLIINLSALNNRLSTASATDDVVAVVKDMWPLILAVENGRLDDARAELKALAQELQQALRDGAPKEKIDELTRRMREAMDRLIAQLQKEGKDRAAQGLKPQGQQGQGMTKEQLQQMLDQIGKLGKDGDKNAAQDMLSQLDQLLQNLEPGDGKNAQNGSGGQNEDLNALSEMMRQQRKLMDQTQRMPGGAGKDEGGNEGLADQQKQLRDKLGKLGQGMSGDEGGDKLGDAGKNMDGAEQSLRDGNKEGALKEQNQALRNMLQGMSKLTQQLGKNGQGDAYSNSREGRDGKDTDPLGRSLNGPNQNLVPSELASRRAHEILEQLRARANEEGLDDETKAYIDRLLKDEF